MKAIVVYESLWGNTAAVARAIAEGLGPGAHALSTAEANPQVCEGADLIVAGAPLMAFTLPTDASRGNLGMHNTKAPRPADLSCPSMRNWLTTIPQGTCRAEAFETRFRWSPGSATKTILRKLADSGYSVAGRGKPFMIAGAYGPMRDGELERAREWGAYLAQTLR